MAVKDLLVGNSAYAKGASRPMLDITKGNQFGWGNDYPGWISSTPYVQNNLICKVLSLPAGLALLDEGPKYIAALKALFELHPKRIGGLQNTLQFEFQSIPFGAGGEVFETPVDAKRAPSRPEFTWDERYNRSIQRILDFWGTELIMDNITKYPNILTRGIKPETLLPYFSTATLLFIEPDPTHQFVVQSWLCSNVQPDNTGQREGRKDPTAGKQLLEHSIPFTAISMTGDGVDRLAQRFLNETSLTGASPNRRPAFVDQVAADVKSGAAGYSENIAAAGRAAIPQ